MSNTSCLLSAQTTKGLFIASAIAVFIYMSAWFLVAKTRRRIDTVDIAWGGGFILVAWLAMASAPSSRSLMIATFVTIWGLRLSIHIWQKSKLKPSGDPRYAEISKKWKGNFWARAYVSVFLLQGALILLVGLPIVVATGSVVPGRYWLTYAGSFVWGFGFLVETLADSQLQNYLKQNNKPPVLQTGLWRYSRHPNYFGELMQWWGIGVISLQVRHGWIGLLGPMVLSFLIIFVSGIPPAERRRLKDKSYQEYKSRTSALIPLPPK